MHQKPRILIVEDNVHYHKIYKLSLEDELSCAIDCAATGEEALNFLEERAYELVLLDYNLPDMNGDEILKFAKVKHTDSHLPVIILTGESQPDLQSKLLNLGADDFIEKGASPEVLISRVRVQLRHKLSVDRATELAIEVDAFTTGVLHDIRNIENSISAYCQMIEILFLEDPQKNRAEILGHIQKLQEKAGSITSYASGIIEKVRVTQNGVQISQVDLADIISELQPFLERSADSSERRSSLEISGNSEAICTDRHFLKLALLNLIQNSIKYTPSQKVPRIEITQRNTEDSWIIDIRDHGPGIPKEDQLRVFQPFVRGKSNATRNSQGFGLGLSMVARAVHKMHGRVWAESPGDKGDGVVMKIAIPRLEATSNNCEKKSKVSA